MNKLLFSLMAIMPTISGQPNDDIKKNAALILGEIDSAQRIFPHCADAFAPFKQNLAPLYDLTQKNTRYHSAKASYDSAGILASQLRAYYKNERTAGQALLAILYTRVKVECEEFAFTAKQAYDTYQFKTPQSKL